MLSGLNFRIAYTLIFDIGDEKMSDLLRNLVGDILQRKCLGKVNTHVRRHIFGAKGACKRLSAEAGQEGGILYLSNSELEA